MRIHMLTACAVAVLATACSARHTPEPTFTTTVHQFDESASRFGGKGQPIAASALEFVRSVCSYDARHEERTSFLDRAAGWVTPDQLTSLESSGRAQLPWRSMIERHESQRARVTGITIDEAYDGGAGARVNAILTTRSTLGTTREFVRFRLWLVPDVSRWMVHEAAGGCL